MIEDLPDTKVVEKYKIIECFEFNNKNVDFDTMPVGDLLKMREVVNIVNNEFPGAVFVGGIALRIWADVLGKSIPRDYGKDVDITKSGQTNYEVDKNTSAGWVDIFPIYYPKEEPFFTNIIYNEENIEIATIPHLFAQKLYSVRKMINESGKVMEKDLVYIESLQQMLDIDQWHIYLESLKTHRPDISNDNIRDFELNINADINKCILSDNISEKVHPDNL